MLVTFVHSTYYFDTRYIYYFISKNKNGLYKCKSNMLFNTFSNIDITFEVKL